MSRAFAVGWRIGSLVCRLFGVYFDCAGGMTIQQHRSQTTASGSIPTRVRLWGRAKHFVRHMCSGADIWESSAYSPNILALVDLLSCFATFIVIIQMERGQSSIKGA